MAKTGKLAAFKLGEKKTAMVNLPAQFVTASSANAKAYYTFSSQSDYNKRFSQISDILSLSNEQRSKLFDSGLDATGGSRIDNLGLTSQYQTGNSYTSDLDNQTIEALATIIVQTSGTGQKVINQTVLLHGWFDTKTQKFISIKINSTN